MIDFSIITPSFNMLGYLKRCCQSVADQENVTLEHIVMDGASTDGTLDWLRNNPHVLGISEPDRGMYDAINKGLRLSKGNLLAYLNCDEQYLPGTLRYVKDIFERFPDVHVLFGDVLLVDANGELVAFRKSYVPRWQYISSSHLYLHSCAMFFRREVVDRGIMFDESFHAVGDADFVIRILRQGLRSRSQRRYCSIFTVTGANMSTGTNAMREMLLLLDAAPGYVRALKWAINVLRLVEKLLSGAYLQKYPLTYSVYTPASPTERQVFSATNGSFRWPRTPKGRSE